MPTTQTELATFMPAAVSAPYFPVLHCLLQRETELKQKAKSASGGGGGVKKERRRRNSLVKEFKWNDEKKLEGRTG